MVLDPHRLVERDVLEALVGEVPDVLGADAVVVQLDEAVKRGRGRPETAHVLDELRGHAVILGAYEVLD